MVMKYGQGQIWIGYMSKFSIYQGKKGEAEILDVLNFFGSGKKDVLYLTRVLFGKHHKVSFNNYYSAVRLAEYLLLSKVSLL